MQRSTIVAAGLVLGLGGAVSPTCVWAQATAPGSGNGTGAPATTAPTATAPTTTAPTTTAGTLTPNAGNDITGANGISSSGTSNPPVANGTPAAATSQPGVATTVAPPPMPTVPASATTNPVASATRSGPAEGANSFTRGQATTRIGRAGYQDVAGLKLDSNGVWRGTALRHGKKVRVWLDYTGRVGSH